MTTNNKNNFELINMINDREKDKFAMRMCDDWYNTFRFVRWNGNWESKKDLNNMCYRYCVLKEVKTNKLVNKSIILEWDEKRELMWVHIGTVIN